MIGIERMTWTYKDDNCRCGLVETEKHVLFECTLYGEEKGRWRAVMRDLKYGMDEYETFDKIEGVRVLYYNLYRSP